MSELKRTMVRAGKFTPAATVEVAKMASRWPCFHHPLDEKLPGRQLSAVMGGHTPALEVMKLPMLLQVREAGKRSCRSSRKASPA